MNSRSSANSTMSSYTASVLRWDRPRNAAFRYTFSLPVSSGWNPAPSSNSPAMRPRCRTTPSLGRRIPAMTFSRVLFPDPFCPIRAKNSPSATSKDTSRSAQKSSARTRPDRMRCFNELGFSRYIRKRFETSAISIAMLISQLLREITRQPEEDPPRRVEQQERDEGQRIEPDRAEDEPVPDHDEEREVHHRLEHEVHELDTDGRERKDLAREVHLLHQIGVRDDGLRTRAERDGEELPREP